jgi:hypothetical protein
VTPTERKYLGLDDVPTGAEKLLAAGLLIGGIWVLKKISDSARKDRGEQKQSWKEWLFPR